MKYRLSEKKGNCCFEEYNKTKNMMVKCNCETLIMAGRNHICREHLRQALSNDKKAEMFAPSKKSGELIEITLVNQFLAHVDGKEYKSKERGLF